MEKQEFSGVSISKIIHSLIGISLMLFGRYLPPLSTVVPSSEKLLSLGFQEISGGVLVTISPTGMLVLSIFFGVVYLWTFVDTLWPSLLAVLVLGISSYAPMPKVLMQFMGNPPIVLLFMLLLFCAAFVRSQIAVYLARALMTQKGLQGKPWLLTGTILLTCYIVGFLEQMASLLVMWPVFYLIFKEVGYKKGDKYVSFMMVNSVIMILLSFATDVVKGGSFIVLSNLYALAEANPALNIEPINIFYFLAFAITLSLIILCLLLLVMRLYGCDVSLLKKLDINVLKANPLPPMNWQQKALIFLFLLYATLMILPGILPNGNVVQTFLVANNLGMSLFIVFLLSIIQHKGNDLLELPQTMSVFPWKVYFLIATAFLLGGAVTAPITQIPVFMEAVMGSWFSGLGYTELIIATVCIAIVVTNFSNSIVCAIIFAPVLASLCNAYGFDSAPLLACFFFTVLIGAATPAASPYAAVLYGNKQWVDTGTATHYALVGSLVVVIVVVAIGIPLATALF